MHTLVYDVRHPRIICVTDSETSSCDVPLQPLQVNGQPGRVPLTTA
jgi:hypothetical protein